VYLDLRYVDGQAVSTVDGFITEGRPIIETEWQMASEAMGDASECFRGFIVLPAGGQSQDDSG